MEASSPKIVWLSTLPRQFGIILEKICDRHERSGITVQWNGGGGGGVSFTNPSEAHLTCGHVWWICNIPDFSPDEEALYKHVYLNK